jgi:uncharacterized protein (TIGR02246 family)
MKVRNINTLTEMMKAVNAGDAKRYAKLYAQNAVVTIYGGDTLSGRGAIEQYEDKLLHDFPGTHLAFYSAWQTEELVVVHYGVNSPNPGGKPTGHEGLLFYRFDDGGLLQEEYRYLDSLTPMSQLGMLGSRPPRPLPHLPTEIKVYVGKGSRLESKNIERVRDNLVALNSKNESAFLSSLARDVAFDDMTESRPFLDRQEVAVWFRNWIESFPDGRAEITNILGVGEFVLIEMELRGSKTGPFGYLAASEKPFVVHRAAIIHVRRNKLNRISTFMNTKELAMSVGQWPLTDLK